MEPPPVFDLFPVLPEEIRLQIWAYALPAPRIVDLRLRNATNRPLQECNRNSGGPWYYTTKSTVSLPLLEVNHEARCTTLESYRRSSIRQQNGRSWRAAYVDFKRDTIYRACFRFDPLCTFDLAYDVIVSNTSSWSCIITKLALHLSTIQHSFFGDANGDLLLEHFNHTDGRKYAVRSLSSIIMRFPAVQQLWLVIDGRDDGFGGDEKLVEPSEFDASYHHLEDLVGVNKAISLIVNDLAMKFPDLALPRIKLTLLKNRKPQERLFRVWHFESAHCEVIWRVPNRPNNSFRMAPSDTVSMSSDSGWEDET